MYQLEPFKFFKSGWGSFINGLHKNWMKDKNEDKWQHALIKSNRTKLKIFMLVLPSNDCEEKWIL